MLPKKLHQIWIGGEPPAKIKEWMLTWENIDGWEYRLWTDDDIEELQLSAEINNSYNLAFAADVMRINILRDHGGVYVDADSSYVGGLDDLAKLDGGFVCSRVDGKSNIEYMDLCFMGFQKDTLALSTTVSKTHGAQSELGHLQSMPWVQLRLELRKTNTHTILEPYAILGGVCEQHDMGSWMTDEKYEERKTSNKMNKEIDALRKSNFKNNEK